jgi:sugar/nucleoside kinase (ribokinase family)
MAARRPDPVPGRDGSSARPGPVEEQRDGRDAGRDADAPMIPRIDVPKAPVRPHRRGPEVVVLGAACRDDDPEDPRGWRLGGGASYTALALARLGLRTAAVIGLDDLAATSAEVQMLVDAGVDLLRVPLATGTIFRNIETPAGRVQTCVQLGDPVPVVPVPDSWRDAPAWMVVPVYAETRDDWAAAIPGHAFVTIGWQGFLRHLASGERVRRKAPERSALLSRADLVGLSHFDVDPETPLVDIARVLRPGTWLVVTQGAHGGMLTQATDDGTGAVLQYPPTPAKHEVDPVGAGDTFLAALTATVVHHRLGGTRSRRGPLDLDFASAAGALAVEAVGLAAAPDRSAVLGRMLRQGIRRVAEGGAGLKADSFEEPRPVDPATQELPPP